MSKRDNKQKELEKRRLRAGRLLLKGVAQVEVARRVGVAKSTVSGWAKRLEAGGVDALRSTRALGRPASLGPGQRAELIRALKQGAMAHGFATELWTLPRVGRLIEERFGLRYSEPHVWRILRQLGFSPQRPSKRALERDEGAIREWKRSRWPKVKKTLQNKDEPSSSSTSRD
jgi:transposase